MNARQRLEDALRAHGCPVRGGAARCPAHEDSSPSLSVQDARDVAGVLVKCHAGCSVEDITAAVGLTPADLFDEPRRSSDRPAVVAEYPYTDEVGTVLFVKQRLSPKSFRQYVPQPDGGRTWTLNGVRRVLYRLPDVVAAVADGRPVYVVEGEKDADALAARGVTATCNTEGAAAPGQSPKWRPEYTDALAGAHVVVVPDRDDPGRAHAAHVAAEVGRVARSVRVVEPAHGKDVSDHLAAGRDVADLVEPKRGSLAEAHETFRRWLGAAYDMDALDAVLATAAVERLDGDPVWLLVLSGPGNAKTETVSALAGAGAVVTSTIASEGALLSATSTKERTKDATGGLLRRFDDGRGVLVIKDVTSLLSMNRDTRAAVLAALREVYDGKWERNVGTDGGRSLSWIGRLAVVGAVTTAWDEHHGVIATMGDRFALLRVDSAVGRADARRQALANVGSEVTMRAELSAAAAGALASIDATRAVLSDEVSDALGEAADLVTLARTGVITDYRGDVVDSHAPEAPTRFAKALAQIVRGMLALGADEPAALRLALRVARDSVPPLRLAVLEDLAAHPDSSSSDVRRRLQKPRTTIGRALDALHALDLVETDEVTGVSVDGRSRWLYSLAAGVDPAVLRNVSGNVSTGGVGKREESDEQCRGSDFPGHASEVNTAGHRCQWCGAYSGELHAADCSRDLDGPETSGPARLSPAGAG